MLGWNLVSIQNEPGQHVEKVVLTKKRNELSNRLRNNPRSSIIMQTPPPSFGTDLAPSGSIFEQQRKARHSTPIPMKSFDPTMFQGIKIKFCGMLYIFNRSINTTRIIR